MNLLERLPFSEMQSDGLEDWIVGREEKINDVFEICCECRAIKTQL